MIVNMLPAGSRSMTGKGQKGLTGIKKNRTQILMTVMICAGFYSTSFAKVLNFAKAPVTDPNN